ncbi:hypothetical protein [Pseudomonas phage vB_PseudoP-SA22]|nr:hypothetical protein [Pseudomonas phage vB_PseudoP-SA22]
MMTYLLIIPAILIYMALSLLVAGIAGLAANCDEYGRMSQKDRDIAIVMGALWPASLPWMCFMAVIYCPLVNLIKSTKRLIKGDY